MTRKMSEGPPAKRAKLSGADGPPGSLFSRLKVIQEDSAHLESASQVVYWMARDQRIQDNWALIYAQQVAVHWSLPLKIVVCWAPTLNTHRRVHFQLEGLKEVAQEAQNLNISFDIHKGTGPQVLPDILEKGGVLVTDMSPLREFRQQLQGVGQLLQDHPVVIYQVDAHNVVPVWTTSDKKEFAARTIRPKLKAKVSQYLTDFPPVIRHPVDPPAALTPVDWLTFEGQLTIDESVGIAPKFPPGTQAGLAAMMDFLTHRVQNFDRLRNDPNQENGPSNLAPWINFGQISAQRILFNLQKNSKKSDAYEEELLIRRELTDNYCYYTPEYDTFGAAADWAQLTLNDHRKDPRDFLYTEAQLDQGQTKDDLWNAAQHQMVKDGKMHGYLRMYWAKKILEWTPSPEEALRISLKLNDRYNLDGCDPNGVVGCMWSIVGTHDRPWFNRPVFGKIRYMNASGCSRKFDIHAYIKKYLPGPPQEGGAPVGKPSKKKLEALGYTLKTWAAPQKEGP